MILVGAIHESPLLFLIVFINGVGIASRARDIPVKNKRSFWNEKRFQDSRLGHASARAG
jgi:hypothetical protein